MSLFCATNKRQLIRKGCVGPCRLTDRCFHTHTQRSKSVVRCQKSNINTEQGNLSLSQPEGSSQNQEGSSVERCVGTGVSTFCEIDEKGFVDECKVKESSQEEVQQSLAIQILSTLLLVSPFFFWGTSMVAMKQVIPHSTPLFTAAVRLIPSGVLLIVWAQQQGRKSPSGYQAWLALMLFGLVDGTGFQGFLAEGLQRTSAGLGSVVIDSQPITVAVLAALFLGESLNIKGIIGLALGVIGLLLIEVPTDVLYTLEFGGGEQQSLLENGEFLMLLAAQSMAVGTVMVPWVTRFCDPVMATGWHMILGGLPLLLLCIRNEGSELVQRLQLITPSDIFALTYSSIFGGAAGYGVYFYNAPQGNITKLSSLTFLTPIFAVSAGYLMLGEALTPIQIVGATITLLGVYLVNNQQNNKQP